MKDRPLIITLIIVGTIAFVAILYSITLATATLRSITPKPEMLSALKDIGLVALGALSSMLARTSSHSPDDSPEKVEVVNKPSDPVPTIENK